MMKSALTKIVMAAACWVGVGIVVACGSSTPTGLNCGEGSQECTGSCTVIARDSQNCGACGKACAASELCSAGSCVPGSGGCTMGTAKCGNECVDNKSDPRNCGACGKACGANEVCMAGACASSCGMGTKQCGMACINTSNDRTNCGACGTMCKDGEVCSNGTCGLSCQQGLTKCAPTMLDGGGFADGGFTTDYCTNLATDTANCGACGTSCAGATPICANSKCSAAHDDGFGDIFTDSTPYNTYTLATATLACQAYIAAHPTDTCTLTGCSCTGDLCVYNVANMGTRRTWFYGGGTHNGQVTDNSCTLGTRFWH